MDNLENIMNFINMNSKRVRKIKALEFKEETPRSLIYLAKSIVKNEILVIEVSKKANSQSLAELIYENAVRKLFTDLTNEYSL